jgi:RNA polymerase sigma-70 factor (ECF subfamily)
MVTLTIEVEDFLNLLLKGGFMMSDKILLRHVKQDDQQALEELFVKYYNRLCEFAFQYVRSFDLTEEVVSDVFLKVWVKRETLTIGGNFKAYLYTAVRNQAIDCIRKEDGLLESLESLKNETASSTYQPDEELIFKEFKNHIEGLINTLPPRRRMIFKMSRLEKLTYKEIADILSISVHTVQNQMVQAVKQLSECAVLDEK